jgi:DNA-binding MarR family transcriptional regulator
MARVSYLRRTWVKSRLDKSEYELLASFRYALRRFAHFSEQAATAAGLEPQQHQAMLAVRGFPGRDYVTLGELAERLQVKPHSAVGLVDRLEKLGLAAREVSSEDARRVHVTLTPRGGQVLESLALVHREELRRVGPQLRTVLERLSRPA